MHCAFLVVAVRSHSSREVAVAASTPAAPLSGAKPRRRQLEPRSVATSGTASTPCWPRAAPSGRAAVGRLCEAGLRQSERRPCTKKARPSRPRRLVVELPASTFKSDVCRRGPTADLLLENVFVRGEKKRAWSRPPPGHRTGSSRRVAGYCADDAEGMESGRPGIVHRLDRFTSGCVVVARDSEARRSLQKQFADRTVAKLYLAVVCRPPPETDADELVIDEPIGRHPIHRERMAVVEGAGALYPEAVLATDGRRCVVQVAIERAARTRSASI